MFVSTNCSTHNYSDYVPTLSSVNYLCSIEWEIVVVEKKTVRMEVVVGGFKLIFYDLPGET